MQFTIKNKNNVPIESFIQFLIKKMQKYFIDNLDITQLKRFDAYIETNRDKLTSDRTKKQFRIRDILIGGIYNLHSEKHGNSYVIKIEPNQIVPGMNVTFENMMRLVNYGNTEVQKYGIFDKTINYFSNNFEEYYILSNLEGD